jgi:hypothetical protein
MPQRQEVRCAHRRDDRQKGHYLHGWWPFGFINDWRRVGYHTSVAVRSRVADGMVLRALDSWGSEHSPRR